MRSDALIAILGVAAFLSSMQAITVAWLSGFPHNATRVEALEREFWLYVLLSLLLALAAIGFGVHRWRAVRKVRAGRA